MSTTGSKGWNRNERTCQLSHGTPALVIWRAQVWMFELRVLVESALPEGQLLFEVS